ncbi:MAG: hypothetical protein M1830_006786 [Pleopsidium flavum]|nr:MAG: hypothetical protein M1830_006786 [Pleopsidium flavum]
MTTPALRASLAPMVRAAQKLDIAVMALITAALVALLQMTSAGAIAAPRPSVGNSPKLPDKAVLSTSVAVSMDFVSHCDQPGSGGSGGDVQSRIIGYYEAWAHDRTCSGMTFQNIPIKSITHLHFSFGYISPGSFQVVPMDSLPSSLFNDLTTLKSQNSALKAIVAIGGWTFNDNGTATQPVFSDMVSSSDNRQIFISNLLSFLRQYAFDGVDFDWEYPGASDRGGKPEDGINFTQFLKELQAAISKGPTKYIVSFTAPTSFWYLRHFDIKGTMDNVDWANVMSYDLHGEWDSTDPIGSHVLAHTNLTEIKQALDLFWRNDVSPNKLNLGLGFYGRSFQLAEPSCWQPGCLFKGGASPGPCTHNSGTLSYKEITQIIDQNKLTPYYDKEDAVKYITWNGDQWVSYDDQDTFQQKIKFANDLGLGGLLIWALDLDTDDLEALRSVIYPKTLNLYRKKEADKSYWEDAAMGDCRVTDCGGSCIPGEIKITSQPCGDATFAFRNSDQQDSPLCCPLSAAPDPASCRWEGTAPSCNGHCHPGQVALESNKWGDGDYCEDGLKFYCCDVPDAKNIQCRWTDCGNTCDSKENSLTYDENCGWGGQREFCCDKGETWKNCAWHGKPGSCFDNHCDTGHQIQLAESWNGGGDDCGIHTERNRVFCCDPPKGKSPFLPVPLDYLFPHPPPKDSADTEFKLSVDPTWGGKGTKGQDDPNDASFGFFVLSSPEELQVSLDKRDGSHWDLFDCFDGVSQEPQTIRMVCTDHTSMSNCNKIYLGKGAPGTILEMPSGCGPGRYAVAKDINISRNQTVPSQLAKRTPDSSLVVYDLTFDYDFKRVPRDLGDTQMRLDFSNQEGYWNGVVDKAGNTKRKRSLDDLGRNHKRWLEEAWREDHHGGLSREELHKRWFGSDVIDWLKGLLSVAQGAPLVDHSISEEFTVLLLDERYGPCSVKGASVEAGLQVKAEANVQVDTSFGMTLISTLAFPPDLSNSHLYFRNKGGVTAKFTLDALTTASFQTGDLELFGLENFGATFSVPGILTVGPNFRVFGSVDGAVTLAGHLESQVNIAKWDIRQTFPDAGPDYEPKALASPDRDGTQILGQPTFNYSVSADGHITAHIKPTITFGIDFNKNFLNVDSRKVDLVADGWLRLHASASTSTTGSSFCYGVDAGADLYASVEAPKAFGWDLAVPRYQLAQSSPKQVIQTTCPIQSRGLGAIRSSSVDEAWTDSPNFYPREVGLTGPLVKRGQVYGPLLRLNAGLTCPGDSTDTLACPLCGSAMSGDGNLLARDDAQASCELFLPPDGDIACSGSISARGWDDLVVLSNGSQYPSPRAAFSQLEQRDTLQQKTIDWTYGGVKYNLDCGYYPQCNAQLTSSIDKWFTFENDNTACTAQIGKKAVNQISKISDFATEHVFEAQILKEFFLWLETTSNMRPGYSVASHDWISGTIMGIQVPQQPAYMLPDARYGLNDNHEEVFTIMATRGLGSKSKLEDLSLTLNGINGAKSKWMGLKTPGYEGKGKNSFQSRQAIRNAAGAFSYLQYQYGGGKTVWKKFTEPSNYMELVLADFDANYQWSSRAGEPTRPANDVGLRNLYCWWIDKYLSAIESNTALWANAAKTYFSGKYKGEPQAENYVKTEMSGDGYATAGKMKFPRVPGGNGQTVSQYGVWGLSGHDLGQC